MTIHEIMRKISEELTKQEIGHAVRLNGGQSVINMSHGPIKIAAHHSPGNDHKIEVTVQDHGRDKWQRLVRVAYYLSSIEDDVSPVVSYVKEGLQKAKAKAIEVAQEVADDAVTEACCRERLGVYGRHLKIISYDKGTFDLVINMMGVDIEDAIALNEIVKKYD